MITHVEARIPLCKTYNPQSKTFDTYPTKVAKVKTKDHDIETPQQLADLLQKLGRLNYAITLGQPDKPLEWERRRKRYNRGQTTNIFVLDVDKLPLTLSEFLAFLPEPFRNTEAVWQPSASMHINPEKRQLSGHLFYILDKSTPFTTFQSYAKHLNLSLFKNYIQLSPTKLFLSWPLDVSIYQPSRLLYIAPPVNSPNPDHPNTQIQVLNRATHNSTQSTQSTHPTLFPLEFITSNTPVEALLVEQTRTLTHELRKEEGFQKLPPNSKSFIISNDTLINPEPGRCHIVDDSDPNFLRLNINDGDSGAYFIYKYNLEYIHNFKGEPKIPLKQFDPDFAKTLKDRYTKTPEALKQQLAENPDDYSILGPLYKVDENNNVVFPFVDTNRDSMHVCIYNTQTKSITINDFSNEKRLHSNLNHHNRELLDPTSFPNWIQSFNPTLPPTQFFNPFTKEISLFQPSDLFRHLLSKYPPENTKRLTTNDQSKLLPFKQFARTLYEIAPLHYQVIHNAVGGQWAEIAPDAITNPDHPDYKAEYLQVALTHLDPATDSEETYLEHSHLLFTETNYLINWMAYILQTREKTRCAWLLQGDSKTGKSSIIQYMFTPILSTAHSVLKDFQQMESQFTAWMEPLVMIGLDECKPAPNSIKQTEIQQSLKNKITEPLLTLQEKHVSMKKGQNTTSYSNFIFCTNASDAVKMEDGERTRFNVGVYQTRSLLHQPPFNDPQFHLPSALETERYKFLEFMLRLPTDKGYATTALNNDAKVTLTDAAMSHANKFALTIIRGNLIALLHMLPSREDIEALTDLHWKAQVMEYHQRTQKIMLDLLLNTTSPSKPNWMSVHEAYTLYLMSDYENSKPKNKNQFMQHLGHLNLPKHSTRQTPRSNRSRKVAVVFHKKIQFKKPASISIMELIEYCGDIITEAEQRHIEEKFLTNV